jgi:hypothetical protein
MPASLVEISTTGTLALAGTDVFPLGAHIGDAIADPATWRWILGHLALPALVAAVSADAAFLAAGAVLALAGPGCLRLPRSSAREDAVLEPADA